MAADLTPGEGPGAAARPESTGSGPALRSSLDDPDRQLREVVESYGGTVITSASEAWYRREAERRLLVMVTRALSDNPPANLDDGDRSLVQLIVDRVRDKLARDREAERKRHDGPGPDGKVFGRFFQFPWMFAPPQAPKLIKGLLAHGD